MREQGKTIFGIDFGSTYSCISYVDEDGQARIIPNKEQEHTTPSIILFDGERRAVGEQAKKSAILNPGNVVEMVKRHLGEAYWRFPYGQEEYSPEEIASYVLRKLVQDAEEVLHIPVKDVVISCPAYFGITQREAIARAGEIAGLNVHGIINEPTAAAITYGLYNAQSQVVLVYDLGGGTFDVTVISIHKGTITVIATGGDHHLGGRNWDEAVIMYLAAQWQNATGSAEDPLESPITLQDLWLKAEKAKWALTTEECTHVIVSHAEQQATVRLTREKFEELTTGLLDRTILFTNLVMKEARKRGYHKCEQILLVGGSTKMPQIRRRLAQEFRLPLCVFEADEVVAKGAALYGQKLVIDQHILTRMSEITGISLDALDLGEIAPSVIQQAQADVARALALQENVVKELAETSIVNVTSHSFGIIATIDFHTPHCREVIENLMLVNDPLPAFRVQTFGTLETGQETVELQIMENTEETLIVESTHYTADSEIGKVILPLPPNVPAHSPIEVTFELDLQGRLRVIGREPNSQTSVEATFETRGGLSQEELKMVKARAAQIAIV